MTTLTVANSSFTISNSSVFAIPIPIQGYATDDAFDTDNIAPNEAIIGVDGNMSAGHTPYLVKLKFVLMADSPSILFMDQWLNAEKAAQDTYFCNATIIAPSLSKIWEFTKGALTGGLPTAPGKKIFQPQHFELTFQSVVAIPV